MVCNTNNIKEKEKRLRDTAERLYRRRYEGIVDPEQKTLYLQLIKKDEGEFWNFANNFMGEMPVQREIFFTKELIGEIEKIAEESNVEISTLVNCYILQMLERNKRTTEHTKARKAYIKNTLYKVSAFIQTCEEFETFEENISDKEFMKYKQISYKNNNFDEWVYIKNFLRNKGYSINQIQEIEREEKEHFGTFETEEGELLNPIKLEIAMEYDVSAFNFEYTRYVFIPTRLGLHYIILNRSDELETYQDIEAYLRNTLKGGKKVWDLYADYLKGVKFA